MEVKKKFWSSKGMLKQQSKKTQRTVNWIFIDNDNTKPTRLILIFQYGIKLNFFSKFYDGFWILNLIENCSTSIYEYVPNVNMQKNFQDSFPNYDTPLLHDTQNLLTSNVCLEADYPYSRFPLFALRQYWAVLWAKYWNSIFKHTAIAFFQFVIYSHATVWCYTAYIIGKHTTQ